MLDGYRCNTRARNVNKATGQRVRLPMTPIFEVAMNESPILQTNAMHGKHSNKRQQSAKENSRYRRFPYQQISV